MRIALKLAPVVALLALGGYWLWQDPRVRDLFRPIPPASERPRPAPSRPPAKESPRAGGAETETPAETGQERVAPQRSETEIREVAQAPNEQVSRVLMQILAARRLSDGISLGVSDEKIVVSGEVDSEEKRRQVLSILDRGREARRVDDSGLSVRP